MEIPKKQGGLHPISHTHAKSFRIRNGVVVKPRSGAVTKELAGRTLTNLYNKSPAWLESAHRTLDAAVFDAYGWPTNLSDDEILGRLLTLNLSRPAAGGAATS